jgi:hypothetical protein
VHIAMKTLVQPGQQTGLAGGKVDTGHANLGESEFQSPGTDVCQEFLAV